MIKSSRSVGLQLLTHSNNLLKMPTWEVGYRSKAFRKELIEVRNIASGKGLCSLSANQVGCYSSFFVVLGRNRLIANKWTGYKAGTSDYEVVVNPKIEKRS
jgi:peptide deformylase